jgi:hypothetical protein
MAERLPLPANSERSLTPAEFPVSLILLQKQRKDEDRRPCRVFKEKQMSRSLLGFLAGKSELAL